MTSSANARTAGLVAMVVAAGALVACPDKENAGGNTHTEAAARAVAPLEDPDPVAAPPVRRVVPVSTRSPAALTAFNAGREFYDNKRDADAIRAFQKAVELDPNFAFAHAYLANYLHGADGVHSLERAQELSRPLPEAERLFIEYFCALREGVHGKPQELIHQVVRLAPDDWRAVIELGRQSFDQRNWSLAVAAYKKAMAIVKTCAAYNQVAYAQAMQGHYDLGVLAVGKCVEMQPNEPNPRDSLGEIQLAAGHLDEAEASFRKATELNATFYEGWHGIAYTHFYKGDWGGCEAALASAGTAAAPRADRAELAVIVAWAQLAHGDRDAALQTIGQMQKEANGQRGQGAYDVVWAAITRSALLHELGRDAEARQAARAAMDQLSTGHLQGAVSRALGRRAQMRELLAFVGLGQVKEAKGVLEFLAAEDKDWMDDPEVAAGLHLARGMVAEAENRWQDAAAELGQCTLSGLTDWSYDFSNKPEDVYCLWQLLKAQEKLADTSGAAKTRELLSNRFSREPVALYVRSKLAPPAR